MKVRFRDIDVHYEEVGSGRPLLLLHGGGPIGSARWAMSNYEALFGHRAGWRRIYVDQMGHGDTPAPPWLRSIDDTVDMTLAVMDKLAPGERFAISGVSWGGYLARGVLHHRSRQIDGAFIWEPNYRYIEDDPNIPSQHVFEHEPGFQDLVQPGEEWLTDFTIDKTAAAWNEVRRMVLVGGASNPDTPAFHRGAGKGFSFDPDELPEPFPGPALILCGRQDNVTGYEMALASASMFPRGTHVVLDRCGHLTQVDQPVLLKALANEWLDRVEEYVGA